MSFEDWKKNVNDIIFDAINLTLDDLPDEDYYIFWDSNYSSKNVADILLNMPRSPDFDSTSAVHSLKNVSPSGLSV